MVFLLPNHPNHESVAFQDVADGDLTNPDPFPPKDRADAQCASYRVPPPQLENATAKVHENPVWVAMRAARVGSAPLAAFLSVVPAPVAEGLLGDPEWFANLAAWTPRLRCSWIGRSRRRRPSLTTESLVDLGGPPRGQGVKDPRELTAPIGAGVRSEYLWPWIPSD